MNNDFQKPLGAKAIDTLWEGVAGKALLLLGGSVSLAQWLLAIATSGAVGERAYSVVTSAFFGVSIAPFIIWLFLCLPSNTLREREPWFPSSVGAILVSTAGVGVLGVYLAPPAKHLHHGAALIAVSIVLLCGALARARLNHVSSGVKSVSGPEQEKSWWTRMCADRPSLQMAAPLICLTLSACFAVSQHRDPSGVAGLYKPLKAVSQTSESQGSQCSASDSLCIEFSAAVGLCTSAVRSAARIMKPDVVDVSSALRSLDSLVDLCGRLSVARSAMIRNNATVLPFRPDSLLVRANAIAKDINERRTRTLLALAIGFVTWAVTLLLPAFRRTVSDQASPGVPTTPSCLAVLISFLLFLVPLLSPLPVNSVRSTDDGTTIDWRALPFSTLPALTTSLSSNGDAPPQSSADPRSPRDSIWSSVDPSAIELLLSRQRTDVVKDVDSLMVRRLFGDPARDSVAKELVTRRPPASLRTWLEEIL